MPRLRTSLPLLAGLLSAATACASAVTLIANPEAERDAIRARSAEFMHAMVRGDETTVMRLMAPDAILMLPHAPRRTTPGDIRAAIQETMALPNLAMSWRPTRIDMAGSGDLAAEIGTYDFGFDAPGMRVSDQGSYVIVWRKIGGEWYVAADIATSSLPLPPPPEPEPPEQPDSGAPPE